MREVALQKVGDGSLPETTSVQRSVHHVIKNDTDFPLFLAVSTKSDG